MLNSGPQRFFTLKFTSPTGDDGLLQIGCLWPFSIVVSYVLKMYLKCLCCFIIINVDTLSIVASYESVSHDMLSPSLLDRPSKPL